MLMITLIIRLRTAISYAQFFRGVPSSSWVMSIWDEHGHEIHPWDPHYTQLVKAGVYTGLYQRHEKQILRWRIWRWLQVIPEEQEVKQLEFDF